MKIIATSDWHIKAQTPISRIEESWWNLVLKPKIQFILDLKLPIYHSGDIFDSYNFISLPILNELKRMFQDADIKIIPGNHDTQGYNWKARKNSAWGNLFDDSYLPGAFAIEGCYESILRDTNIFMYHGYVAKDTVPWFIENGLTAKELMEKYPGYKIYLTGDNHEAFTVESKGRILINAGSLTRNNIKQKNFKPRIYILDTSTLEYEKVYIPIQQDVWQETSEVLESFNIDSLKEKFEETDFQDLDFNQIVIKLLKGKSNKIKEKVSQWML